MEKLKVHISAGGDARMSPLWWVEMSLEKIVADIHDHLNLRYQGSMIDEDAVSNLVLKELTWEPIGYGALHPLPDNRTVGKIAGQLTRPVLNPCKDEHEPVYSQTILGGWKRWICSECGLMGREPYDWKQAWPEYDKLVDKFHGNS